MVRLPNTVMNMAPAINEYMAARIPSGLSLSEQDPFSYSEQLNVSFRKSRNTWNFVREQIKYSVLHSFYRKLKKDMVDSRKILYAEILVMIFLT